MMPAETSKNIDGIEAEFLYDVTKVTVALFYLLQGMEIASHIIASHIYVPNPDEQPVPHLAIAGPILTNLKTFPAVSTTGPDMCQGRRQNVPLGRGKSVPLGGWTVVEGEAR